MRAYEQRDEETRRIIKSMFKGADYLHWTELCLVIDATQQEILSKSRKQRIVTARQIICCFLIYQGMTLERAGEELDLDHSTVIYSTRVMTGYYSTRKDKYINDIIKAIRLNKKRIGSHREVDMLIILENKLNKVVY